MTLDWFTTTSCLSTELLSGLVCIRFVPNSVYSKAYVVLSGNTRSFVAEQRSRNPDGDDDDVMVLKPYNFQTQQLSSSWSVLTLIYDVILCGACSNLAKISSRL